MSFGAWMRRIREAKGLSLQSIADVAQSNVSTLSRIENETISPTVKAAVLILNALEVHVFDFYQAVIDTSFPTIPEQATEEVIGANVPTVTDAIAFHKFFNQNPQSGLQFLSRYLSKIFEVVEQGKEILEDDDYFRPIDVARLLEFSPLYTGELHYPYQLEPNIILKIYQQGGVIIRSDVDAYLQHKRDENRMHSNRSVMDLLNQVWQPLGFRKIRLADLVKVDRLLDGKGELPVMSCMAVDFELRVDPTLVKPLPYKGQNRGYWGLWQFRAGYVFILMHRWMEHFQIPVTEWLQEARQLISRAEIGPTENKG